MFYDELEPNNESHARDPRITYLGRGRRRGYLRLKRPPEEKETKKGA